MVDQKIVLEMKKFKDETIKEMQTLISNRFDTLTETMTSSLVELEERLCERIDDVETEMGTTKEGWARENESLRTEVERLKKLALDAKSHAVANEQYSRKCNVKVFGIPEDKDENCTTKVTSLISEKLGIVLNAGQVVVAHRTRAAKKPCPMIVRFDNFETKMKIMRARSKLRGNAESIGEDMCRDLILVLNRARKDERIAESWAWNGRIHVKDVKNKITTLQYGQSLDDALWQFCAIGQRDKTDAATAAADAPNGENGEPVDENNMQQD